MKNTILLGALGIFIFPSFIHAASLSVAPDSHNGSVGEIITVNVKLDTQGQPIEGTDVILNYNPAKLEVVDFNSQTTGVQIAAHDLFSIHFSNDVDTINGKIVFSHGATLGTQFNGEGTIATIHFKTLEAGESSISFDHTAGKTTDSNIAAQGQDILTEVTNTTITVGESSEKESFLNEITANVGDAFVSFKNFFSLN